MAKSNPNRQQLIEFINEINPELDHKINKIQDLSSGVHYLFLLAKLHPDVVKLNKVNVKAMHEHQNVNNLKLLAYYLAQVKANFTVEVQKISQRNYQENLNLMKNLYKYYYIRTTKTDEKVQKPKNQEKRPLLAVVKGPPKPIHALKNRQIQQKKVQPQKDGFKNIVKQNRNHAQQQLRAIKQIVNDNTKTDKDEKLNKIKSILGMQTQTDNKNKKQGQIRQIKAASQCGQINYSTVCSGSKSILTKRQSDFQTAEKDILKQSSKQPQTQNVNRITGIHADQAHKQNMNNNVKTDAHKQKKFDCEQLKRSMLKKYDLRSNSLKKQDNKRNQRLTISNIQNWQVEQQDTKVQNLLSPQPSFQKQNQKEEQDENLLNHASRRKSILRKSLDGQQLMRLVSKSRNPQEKEIKRVHFSTEKSSTKKYYETRLSKRLENQGQIIIEIFPKPSNQKENKQNSNSNNSNTKNVSAAKNLVVSNSKNVQNINLSPRGSDSKRNQK